MQHVKKFKSTYIQDLHHVLHDMCKEAVLHKNLICFVFYWIQLVHSPLCHQGAFNFTVLIRNLWCAIRNMHFMMEHENAFKLGLFDFTGGWRQSPLLLLIIVIFFSSVASQLSEWVVRLFKHLKENK